MLRSLLILATLAFSLGAQAYTLEFQPTVEVYKCPPGATWVIMQCQLLTSQVLPPVRLKLQPSDVTDPAYVAEWSQSVTAPGEPPTYFQANVLRYHYENKKPFIILTASAGWSTGDDRNSSLFLETAPTQVPTTLMITGDRLVEGDYELVTDLQLSAVSFH